MPELPEVETVVRQLAGVLPGNRIEEIHFYDPLLGSLSELPFHRAVVSGVRRLGKQVVVILRTEAAFPAQLYLIVHLRMTGRLLWYPNVDQRESDTQRTEQLFLRKTPDEPRDHARASFLFEHGELLFTDVRRFGTVELSCELDSYLPRGIDPLGAAFSLGALEKMLFSSRQSIKQFLLRQDRLVGLGNIYACEILFRSRINPQRLGCTLSKKEIRTLYRTIPRLLRDAIECSGTTFSDFQSANGGEGGFQEFLSVYQREGLPCKKCRHKIERIRQQGRSTFYCPCCQCFTTV